MNIYNSFLIICLLGPTCTNKSNLVLLLGKYLPIEIINVDSTQVYKYMNIGTNKPTLSDRKKIPHHLIDILDPSESYSIYKFFFDVNNLLIDIFQRKNIPVLVGGSMLYFNILFNGLNFSYNNITIKNSIYKKLHKQGILAIYKVYNKFKYNINNIIHINDTKRIIRQLEIIFSSKLKKNINKYKLKFNNIIKFFIYPLQSNIIKKRIKFRFYKMLSLGLEKEVEFLFLRKDLNEKLSSINSIGYKQMWYFFLRKITYNQMIYKSILATNKLLKHQYTWLKTWKKKFNDIIWLNDININKNFTIIMNYIKQNNILINKY